MGIDDASVHVPSEAEIVRIDDQITRTGQTSIVRFEQV
jgi:hypothetical protein